MDRILPTMKRVLGGKAYLIEDVAKTSVHSPAFIADEDAIPVGVALMSAVILDYLKKAEAKSEVETRRLLDEFKAK